ncbi:MAG: capsular polysaccharide synthesis protein [Muribaculaceae bacterium]|nr:capsular polysaccharide synthesis protein [Muribaculaceae bacterium]
MSSWIRRVAGRAGMQMHLIFEGHIANPFWHGREARRKKRYKATRESAMGYLQRYAPAVSKVTPEAVTTPAEPERAFTIWFQGEDKAPELVKACFRSMRRNLKQELVVLDKDTLFDWISLPEHIVRKWKEGKILHTQFSDICRVELLYEHGGLWLDATDYVTAPVPQYIMDEDLFMFMAGNKIRGSYALIQSCFIRARKGNPVLGVWREANSIYWKEENSKINYFIHHLLLKLSVDVNGHAALGFSKMPRVEQDPTHALWGEHCNDPFDEESFRKLTSGAFFQKTNYKDKRLNDLRPGSVAEFIINS